MFNTILDFLVSFIFESIARSVIHWITINFEFRAVVMLKHALNLNTNCMSSKIIWNIANLYSPSSRPLFMFECWWTFFLFSNSNWKKRKKIRKNSCLKPINNTYKIIIIQWFCVRFPNITKIFNRERIVKSRVRIDRCFRTTSNMRSKYLFWKEKLNGLEFLCFMFASFCFSLCFFFLPNFTNNLIHVMVIRSPIMKFVIRINKTHQSPHRWFQCIGFPRIKTVLGKKK